MVNGIMDRLNCYNCKHSKIRNYNESFLNCDIDMDVIYCKEYDKIFFEDEADRRFICIKHERKGVHYEK